MQSSWLKNEFLWRNEQCQTLSKKTERVFCSKSLFEDLIWTRLFLWKSTVRFTVQSCIGTWSALQQLRGGKFHTSGKGDGNWCSCGRYNIPPTENSTPNRMERDLKNFMIDYDACVFVQIISNYNFDKYPKNNGNNGSRVFWRRCTCAGLDCRNTFVAIIQSISSAFWPIQRSMLGTNCIPMVPKLSALTSMMFEIFNAVSHVCSRRFVRFAQYFEIWEYQFVCKNCSKSSNFQTFYKSI